MRVECEGKPIGGNNVQVVTGTPDKPRYGLDRDVALWLASGWWLSLRNEFSRAPDIAGRIVAAVAGPLSEVTEEAQRARGAETEELTARLFEMALEAAGPRYWRP